MTEENRKEQQLMQFLANPATDSVSDEIESRFPNLVKLLYLSYKYGFHDIREMILDRLADAADFGGFDLPDTSVNTRKEDMPNENKESNQVT